MITPILIIIFIGIWNLHRMYGVEACNNSYRITRKYNLLWEDYFYYLDFKYSFLWIQIKSCAGKTQVNKWIEEYKLEKVKGRF